MFDWYPVINKSNTFFELFLEAFFWSFWIHTFLWILVFCSGFFSKYIIVFFHRKILAYSFIVFIPLFLILLSLSAIYNGDKPSNSLLYGTIFIIPIFGFCVLMFIQSSRFKNNNKILKKESQYQIENLGAKFQEISSVYQILFLVLFFLLIFSFNLLFSTASWRYYYLIFIVSFFSVYVFVLYKKMKKLQGIKIPFKSSDYIPVLIIIIIFTLISTVTIGNFVCMIPEFNCYFSCEICK